MNVGRKLVGRPVILQETGAKVGRIKDVIYDPNERRILGLKVEQDGLWPRVVLVPWYLVRVDNDAVLVESDNISEARLGTEASAISELVGAPVVTETGQQVGNVADVVFTKSWDKVEGVELSEGVIPDFIDGRNIVLQDNIVAWGKDGIVVHGALVPEQEEKR
ncbi:MAG: PRC-barrel domain-containing protein [Clostridia bacterium]|nr:PRC-barrel domain-containing protein [Clostridia bacterium]